MDIEKSPHSAQVATDPEGMKHVSSKDVDMALGAMDMDVTPEEMAAVDMKKLVRKIDLHLIPIVRNEK